MSVVAQAEWKGIVIAESDDVEEVEGNVYFPMASVKAEHLTASSTHTTCSWKGVADYFNVVVGDDVNKDAAWTYPRTLPAAKHVEGRIAFWRGITVSRG